MKVGPVVAGIWLLLCVVQQIDIVGNVFVVSC